ncbi:MAG: CAP domain-containing protein [Desulfomonilaceae bacterium]|nr:CAP domain-containing protein [Desulfomonilaceae bacterium]
MPVVLLASVMACGPAHGQRTAGDEEKTTLSPDGIAKVRTSILHYTNQERTKAGLRPLTSSAALDYLAQAQSVNMCGAVKQVNWGHTKNKCSLPNFNHESDLFPVGWRAFDERLRRAGLSSGSENIACRTLDPDLDAWARTIVRGWMTSTHGHHKRNILSRRHRFLGVGVVGCIERIGYATQVFSDGPGRIGDDDERGRHRPKATNGRRSASPTMAGPYIQ